MFNKKISRRYSSALYETAIEQNVSDKIRNDLLLLKNTIDDSKDMRLFLKSPIINSVKKRETFNLIFKDKVNELTIKLFDLLVEKNREFMFYDIITDFLNLLNEKEKIIEIKVKTAIEIEDYEKKNIINRLKDYTGKNIEASYVVDPSIKGGFVAQFEDTIIDASIKHQLELLHEQLKKGSFINN